MNLMRVVIAFARRRLRARLRPSDRMLVVPHNLDLRADDTPMRTFFAAQASEPDAALKAAVEREFGGYLDDDDWVPPFLRLQAD